MNFSMILNILGRMAMVVAALLLLPLVVALIYGEHTFWAFLISIGISLAIGGVLLLLFRPKSHVIYAKEGFVAVALVWLFTAGVGALPFVFSGEIPSYIDAFFETVSGFTTTGSSILLNVEALSHASLFWRSFTHWVGGMGVLVFVMAIIPNVSDRSIHLMRAEVPGPSVGKLVPRIKDTAKILYLIYIVMTVLEVIFLLCGGMSLFESIVHAFGTAGTGGFGIKADGLASYSPYLQWVITIFMLIFGINFNLFYLLLLRRFRDVVSSGELWVYLGMVAVSIGLITNNISALYSSFSEAIRHASFQVASVVTTTGYATADFNLWPGLSKGILLVLMFVGGCAGSTAGGIKQARVVLLFKACGRELRRMLHPRSVSTVKFEGRTVEEGVLTGTLHYLALYIFCFALLFLALSFEPFSIETNFSAAASCFNNIGPGLDAVGPMANYAAYSGFSKILLSFAMLFGRLEIYPMLLLFSLSTWSKK